MRLVAAAFETFVKDFLGTCFVLLVAASGHHSYVGGVYDDVYVGQIACPGQRLFAARYLRKQHKK